MSLCDKFFLYGISKMTYDNDGPVYSILNGKPVCSGSCSWFWEDVCGSGGWNQTSTCAPGNPGPCNCPYPSFDGVDGQTTTTQCA